MRITKFTAVSLVLLIGPMTIGPERAMAQGASTPPAAQGAASPTAQGGTPPAAQGAPASPDQVAPASRPARSKPAASRSAAKGRAARHYRYAGRRLARPAIYALPPGYCVPPPYYYQFRNHGGPVFGPCWWVWQHDY
jgi:hypothetical protein